MGLTNTQKIVLSLVIFLVLLIGWGMFPLFFKWVMVGIGSKENELKDFGSLGDIYGSLNTLFTSATLIIVLYSAYLQREANKDAREAMKKQLQQARDATAQQLREARRSTREQIQQARDATEQQLEMSQSIHSAQMVESKHAIFSNMFNILLNQKNEAQERLNQRLGEKNLQSLFGHLAEVFDLMIANDWKEFKVAQSKQRILIKDKLFEEIEKYTGESTIFDELQSYFYIYCSLVTLIKNKEDEGFDTDFYFGILSNLMSQAEQETFLWHCTASTYFRTKLKGSKLFDAYFSDEIAYFIFRNFKKSLFNHPIILKKWRKYDEENPA